MPRMGDNLKRQCLGRSPSRRECVEGMKGKKKYFEGKHTEG